MSPMAVEIDLGSCGAPAAAALDLVAAAGVQALEQLRATVRPEQLEQAVDLLAGAGAIHIVGQRRAFAVAAYLAHALGQLGARAHLLTGTGGTTLQQANLIAPGHVVLAVSFAPHALETLAVAHQARERGVPLIVLADGPLGPLLPLARVAFEAEQPRWQGFGSLSAAMCLASALALGMGRRRHRNSCLVPQNI
jgi:DNA-binding MurR/RpiR family transcriptional regulator